MSRIFFYFLFGFLLFRTGNVEARFLQVAENFEVNDVTSFPIEANETQTCFNLFFPKLRLIANEWSQAYNDCLTNATSQRLGSVHKLKLDQATINSTAAYIGAGLAQCQGMQNEVDFFSCFSGLKGTALNSLFAITVNASDDLNSLRNQSTGFNANFYECTNATQRRYLEETAQLNVKLDLCLNQADSINLSDSSSGETIFTSISSDLLTTVVISTGQDTATPILSSTATIPLSSSQTTTIFTPITSTSRPSTAHYITIPIMSA